MTFVQQISAHVGIRCWNTLSKALHAVKGSLVQRINCDGFLRCISVCAACMLEYRCLQMKWWAAVTVVAIPSQKALLLRAYVSSGKFSVLAPRCSRALLHNLQLAFDRCLIFASHLAIGMIPAIAMISRLLCIQETRGSFAIRTLCFHFAVIWSLPSTCHMQVIEIALLCPSLHTRFQEFSVINPSVLLQDPHWCFRTMPHIVACVCSPLCHHLYTIFHLSP